MLPRDCVGCSSQIECGKRLNKAVKGEKVCRADGTVHMKNAKK